MLNKNNTHIQHKKSKNISLIFCAYGLLEIKKNVCKPLFILYPKRIVKTY